MIMSCWFTRGYGCLTFDDHWAWQWSKQLIIVKLPLIPNWSWSGATTSSVHSPGRQTWQWHITGGFPGMEALYRGCCNVSTKSHLSVKRCASWLWDFSSAWDRDPPGPKPFFVEATLTKPGLTDVGSLVRACKSPQKGDMGIHGVLSSLPYIRFCMVAPQTPVIIVLPCNIVAWTNELPSNQCTDRRCLGTKFPFFNCYICLGRVQSQQVLW